MDTDLETKILLTARAHQLDPELIRAQVIQESSGNPWAYNPEQRYRYFWDVKLWKPFRTVTDAENGNEFPPSDFPTLAGDRDQEWWAQQASWGLMQVMGAVAREHGFREPWLTKLCDPDLGLTVGCRVMKSLMQWSGGVADQALAAYNGGRAGNSRPPYRNAEYIKKVRSHL